VADDVGSWHRTVRVEFNRPRGQGLGWIIFTMISVTESILYTL
jgi:hypothetical protein